MNRVVGWLAGAGVLVVLAAVVPASASATVYWANYLDPPHSIGYANDDGTGVKNKPFPTAAPSCDVAANSAHVYFTGGEGVGYVGRASIANGGANNTFILTADDLPCGVAVNSSHVFFNNYASGAIGRANLDGGSINHTFITGGVNPQHPAVGGGKIFWTNKGFGCPPGCTVGAANLDGNSVNQNFVTGTNDPPSGTAANDDYVYWGNGGKIGRVDINGNGANPNFIDTASGVCDVAVSDTHIYWTYYGDEEEGGWVSRAKLDGSQIEEEFIQTGGYTCGVAVSAGGAGGFTFITKPVITCAGTCRVVLVKITFDEKGNLVAQQIIDDRREAARGVATTAASKPLIKTLKQKVKAGKNKLKLKLTKTGKAQLKKTGKVKAKMKFTFKPSGGGPKTVKKQTLKIKQK